MRLTGAILILMMFACSKADLKETLLIKINLFSQHENKYFQNISITPLSREPNQKSPKQFEVRKKGRPNFAVIQTVPENRILKNYYSDSLTLDFVKAFSELDLTWLHNYNAVINDTMSIKPITHLEFRFGKENIIIFRGNPYPKDRAQMIIDRSTGLTDQWRFAIYQ